MDAEQQVPEAIGSTGSSHTQPPVASHLSLLPASSLFPSTQQSKITSSKEELQDERMRNGSFTMSQPLKMDGQKPGVLPSFIIHEESKESLSLESEDEEMINCDILIEEQQEPATVVQQLVGNEDKKKTSFDEQNENEDKQHENEHQQNKNEDNQNENEKQSPKNESTNELCITQSNDGIDPHKNEDMRNEDTGNEDTGNEDTGNEDTGNEDHDTRVEHEVGQNENEDIEIENLSTPNSPQQYQSKSHTKVPETISALTLDVITSSPLSLAAKEIDDSSLFRFTNPIPPLSKAEVLHTLSNEIITDGVEVPLVSYFTPPQWRCASTSPPCKRQKVLLPALSPLGEEEEEDDLDDGEATLFQALPKEGAKESVAHLPGNASCSSQNSSHRNNDDKNDDCFTVPDDPVLVHEEEDITSFHSDIITNGVSIDTKSDVNEEQSRRKLVVSPPMTKPVLKRGKKECKIN